MAKRKVAKKSVAIGTWPTPEKPLVVKIPAKLIKEFKKDVRFVVRRGETQGIILPDNVLRPGIANRLRGFEIMLVPK
ncbi:MAG: hypothetical protein ACYS8Z_15150 [Planctomycetota bacterium]|jgi:hypothetical protein